ncbi:pentatricopeptide repeat-containing protein At1g05750, chloroplastic [Apium graveolens]|uniref:pentatricopeptide repeat-containing protein At1g05750, chloroplastic n=1 Tax=Apium graveolens TaxID=4045 RepID=UPI003D7917EE
MSFPASLTHPSQPPFFPHQNHNQPFSHHSIIINNYKHHDIDLTASWTSSISHYCRANRLSEAASEFTAMRVAGVEPNEITFVTLLSGCANVPLKSLHFGICVHGLARKLGFDVGNVKVGTAIVNMYSKCGRVDLARVSFDELDVKNKVSWNSMIDGYMRNGEFEEAVKVFDEMPDRDVISYTVMIDGFVKKGYFEQGLKWFQEMQMDGVEPDYVTISCVLSACANLGALGLGLWIHRFVIKKVFRDNIRVNNSLIDMYARCGSIEFSRQIFNSMPKRSVVTWNSIIVGFALNGKPEEALEYFSLMRKDGFEPDGVSFTGALTACSHTGLVDEGIKLFDTMKRVYRIVPRIEHYGCLVDLYSRAGRLDDALRVIENMPMKPNEVILGSLLAACRTRGDITLAERLINYLMKLGSRTDSNYVLVSNIYAAVGSWQNASNVRRKMKARGIQKKPGVSSIEIDCMVHKFMAGDKTHVDRKNIHGMLELLSSELNMLGYVPETSLNEQYEHD